MKLMAMIFFLANLLGQPYMGPSPDEEGYYDMKIPEKLQRMSREERLADAVAYYSKEGFFAEEAKDALYQRADRKLKEDWGAGKDPFEPMDPWGEYDYADYYLLAMDQNRVWMKDLEADVGPGNDVYVRTLQQWGAISKGVFAPVNVVETWKSDEGPAEIKFEWRGKPYSITAENYSDFLDIDILHQLNPLIKETGYQFGYTVIDQLAVVICLKEEQFDQWAADRGLRLMK